MLRVANSGRIADRPAAAHHPDLRGQLPRATGAALRRSVCWRSARTGRPEKQGLWLAIYVAIYAVVYCCAIDVVYGLLQMGVVLSLPILRC